MSETQGNLWLRVSLSDSARVLITINVEVARSAVDVWSQIQDWKLWMCHDPFHSRVQALDTALKAGTHLRILHGLLGVGFWRVGRILEVRKGKGFSFSDLSIVSKGKGFPHIYHYDVLPRDEQSSTIQVCVRGHWTATFLPNFVVMFWLTLVSFGIWQGIQMGILLGAAKSALSKGLAGRLERE